jgi:hypothetical protein
LTTDDHDYNGSKCNVLIAWENGEIESELLSHIVVDENGEINPDLLVSADCFVQYDIYARGKGLLNEPGCKWFKTIAKVMVNQATSSSYNTTPRFNYGYKLLNIYELALELDSRKKNTKWKDATDLKLMHYGNHHKCKPPAEDERIRLHIIFDGKHDGRHKTCLVISGKHLTDIPVDSVYSSVFIFKILLLLLFLVELHLATKTLIDWFCKTQSTVDKAACGSKLVKACTCMEQVKSRYMHGHSLGITFDSKVVIAMILIKVLCEFWVDIATKLWLLSTGSDKNSSMYLISVKRHERVISKLRYTPGTVVLHKYLWGSSKGPRGAHPEDDSPNCHICRTG